jgi:hypothetical protein
MVGGYLYGAALFIFLMSFNEKTGPLCNDCFTGILHIVKRQKNAHSGSSDRRTVGISEIKLYFKRRFGYNKGNDSFGSKRWLLN